MSSRKHPPRRRADPKRSDAWLRVGQARTCLLDIAGGFYSLRREIEAVAGPAVARQSLYAAGVQGARSVIGSLLDSRQIASDEPGFHAAVQEYTQAGFGHFRVDSLDLAAGRATISAPDAFEGWAFGFHHEGSEQPVCDYSAGVLAAIMQLITTRPDIVCDEATCTARGDACCTFHIMPAAEADQRVPTDATSRVSEYLARGTSLLEEKAREAELLERYRLLTENATDIIFSLDREGLLTFVSKRVETILGYAPAALTGRPVLALLGEAGGGVAMEHLHRSLASPQYTAMYELAIPRADGSLAYLAISVASLVKDGVVIGQQGIARDITSQVHLREEIARRSQELRLSEERRSEMRDYMILVTRALEEERKRVARELHDDTAQSLVALVRNLDALLLDVEDRPDPRRRLEETRSLAEATLRNVRRFSRDLRPSLLDDLGLVPALEWLTDDLMQQHHLDACLDVRGEIRRLEPEVELSLFRIVQEALSNVRRHARARHVVVHLVFQEGQVDLEVTDDGVGFVPADRPADLASARGLGLRGMRERAELIGAQFTLTSTPGGGTRVHLTAPV